MEILTAIRFKSIPVVVFSTSDVESDVIKSYQLGAASYVSPSAYSSL